MSAGTKVSIAVIVLFGAILGVYYGFGGPPWKDAALGDGPAPTGEDTAAEAGRVRHAAVGPADPTETFSSPGTPFSEPVLASEGGLPPTDGEPDDSEEDVWILRAPTLQSGTPPAPPVTPGVQYTDYVVQENDSLWTIADFWFGDSSRWPEIADANPRVNPDRLRLGQRLRLPAKTGVVALNRAATIAGDGPSSRDAGVDRFYTVRSGDTLTRIAVLEYRDTDKWRVIYEANRALIGWDPDRLKVGMRLRIPAG